MVDGQHYTGRFAPSPTGPLHQGSLVAALASFLDANVHHGTWLLRIEDVDSMRCKMHFSTEIIQQLTVYGFCPQQPISYQSRHHTQYASALNHLQDLGLVYPCHCTRSSLHQWEIDHGVEVRGRYDDMIYPSVCKHSPREERGHFSWRLNLEKSLSYLNRCSTITWMDRRLGVQHQNLLTEVGDFVLQRADGCFTYQLAMVVDDANQGVTDVVRGADLLSNTARQILLQQLLGLGIPRYLHVPLVLGENGEKLSKQNCAMALAIQPISLVMDSLIQAANTLGLSVARTKTHNDFFSDAATAWQRIYD